MVVVGGSGWGSGLVVAGASGWDNEAAEDVVDVELAPNGSPKLNSADKLGISFSAVGEIGESGSGVCVGEGGVVSAPGDGVGAFVDAGVLVAFVETSVDGFDTSPIPKDREARSLSSNRDRGLLGSYTPPLAIPSVPVRAGLDGRCACNDLRMLESAESAR